MRMALPVFAVGLLRIVTAVGDEITPDSLLACLLTWYFVLAAGLVQEGSARRAFAAGLLGGLCFLVKAYAVPFVAAHLCVTGLLRWRLVRKGRARGGVAGPLAAGLAGLLLAAAPWIAVISVQGRRLMINSGGASAEAWGPLAASGPLPVHRLQRPRAGRVTSWENPAEIAYPWPKWAARPNESRLAVRIRAAAANARDVLKALVRADGVGLLLAGTVVAGLLGAASWGRGGDARAALRVWALASFAIYVAGLLGLWVYERFCWPVWGLMLAMFFSALDWLVAAVQRRLTGRGGPPRGGRSRVRAAAVLVAAIMVAGVAWRVHASAGGHWGALPSARRGAQARRAARMVSASGAAARPIAANRWRRGLFAAYWAGRPYLGELGSRSPDEIAAELAPFGRAMVLIYDDTQLARALGRLESFQLIDISVDRRGRGAVGWLEFHPGSDNAVGSV